MGIKNASVLVVDDDLDVLMALRLLLKPMVKRVITEQNPNNLLHQMGKQNIDVVILDMNFNTMVNTGNEGIYWLNQIKLKHPEVSVVRLKPNQNLNHAQVICTNPEKTP